MIQYKNTLAFHAIGSLVISAMVFIRQWKQLPGTFAVASITLGAVIGIMAMASLFYVIIFHKEITKKLCLLYENWLTAGVFTTYFVIVAIQNQSLLSFDTLVATVSMIIMVIRCLQNIGFLKKEEK